MTSRSSSVSFLTSFRTFTDTIFPLINFAMMKRPPILSHSSFIVFFWSICFCFGSFFRLRGFVLWLFCRIQRHRGSSFFAGCFSFGIQFRHHLFAGFCVAVKLIVRAHPANPSADYQQQNHRHYHANSSNQL